jgi:hypothetical protein
LRLDHAVGWSRTGIGRVDRSVPQKQEQQMSMLGQIKQHMEIIGANGVHVGTVDAVEAGCIKMILADSGSHKGHYHYLSGGQVAGVEGNRVRLSAAGDAAILLKEEANDAPIADRNP